MEQSEDGTIARVLPVPEPGDVQRAHSDGGEVGAAAGAGGVCVAAGVEDDEVEGGRAYAAEHVRSLLGPPLRKFLLLWPWRLPLLHQRPLRHGPLVSPPRRRVALGARLPSPRRLLFRTSLGFAGVAIPLTPLKSIKTWLPELDRNDYTVIVSYI